MVKRSILLGLMPLALVTCVVEPAPGCGDGRVASPEECDDANTQDGDGCSSICETEAPTPECVDLIETEHGISSGLLALGDGRVLVSGQIGGEESGPLGWVGAFDSEGAQLWSLELEDESVVYSMVAHGGGYAAIAASASPPRIIEFDDAGVLTGSTILSDPEGGVGAPYDLLETSSGLMLAGVYQEDLWLGRLRPDGTIETLLTEDHAGHPDRFLGLVRKGEQIGALATVGVADHSDGDSLDPIIEDTLLLIYDDEGVEVRRTVLSSGDDRISLIGNDLALVNDDTWVIAGRKEHQQEYGPGSVGWVAAVRDGELVWSLEPKGEQASTSSFPTALLHSASALGEDVLVAGALGTDDGVRRWSLHLSGDDGSVYSEQVGAPTGTGYDSYVAASALGNEHVWLSGVTNTTEGVKQWMCSIKD